MKDQLLLTFTLTGAMEGVKKYLPVIVGIIPYGMVFGIMARHAGLSFGEAVFMSAGVFAGAAQLIALTLWQTPLPVFTIVLTTLLVNLRLVLMSATLRPWLSQLTERQSYFSLLFMTDGGWAVTLREFNEGSQNGAFLLGNGFAQYFLWVISTILGFTLGNEISDPRIWGLDYIIPATFLILLIGLWRGKSVVFPWLVAIFTSFIASKMINGNWYILIGGLAGSLAGALFGKDKTDET